MSAKTLGDAAVASLPRHGAGAVSLTGWLTRLFDRLETWSTALQMREVEAYLAQARDAADLEDRMRRLQDARRSRPLWLR